MSVKDDSAILFSNEDQTIFVLDTPQSIAQAQILSSHQQSSSPPNNVSPGPERARKVPNRRYLLSTTPLAAPYPTTTEPKSDSARAKVLARIPESERIFHGTIAPIVEHALEIIRQNSEQRWYIPRRTIDENIKDCVKVGASDSTSASIPKKRSRTDSICQQGLEYLSSNRNDSSGGLGPPIILSSSSPNIFSSKSELDPVVKNLSSEPAILSISTNDEKEPSASTEYIIPPRSTFLLCNLPLSDPLVGNNSPIPGMSKDEKFNLLLFDPPWPNKSVRRSRHYQTHPYAEMDLLTRRLTDILSLHAYRASPTPITRTESGESAAESNPSPRQSKESIAAIWITNAEKARRAAYTALSSSGFRICEEWIWIKVTAKGEPISPPSALWRKPYEILVIGRRNENQDQDQHRNQDQNQNQNFSSSQSTVNTDMHIHMHMQPDPASIGPNSEPDFHTLIPMPMDGQLNITRRVIAAVPDLHSRKPNLRELFERIIFTQVDSGPTTTSSSISHGARSLSPQVRPYTALEVFARNLTAGWWACGNEVIKFNDLECWVEGD